jgi:hypothetical protein
VRGGVPLIKSNTNPGTGFCCAIGNSNPEPTDQKSVNLLEFTTEIRLSGPFGGHGLVVIYLNSPKLVKLLEGEKRAKDPV